MKQSIRKAVSVSVAGAFLLSAIAMPLSAAPLGIAGAHVAKAAPAVTTDVRRGGRRAAIIAGAVALGVIGATAAQGPYYQQPYGYDPYAPGYDSPYGYAPYAAPRQCWQQGFQGISDGQWVPC